MQDFASLVGDNDLSFPTLAKGKKFSQDGKYCVHPLHGDSRVLEFSLQRKRVTEIRSHGAGVSWMVKLG